MSQSENKMIGKEVSGCKIIEEIAKGNRISFYKAKQMFLNRYVAIKVLSPTIIVTDEMMARFRQEAYYTATLEHPNIVQLNEFFIDDQDNYVMILQYIEGGNLGGILNAQRTVKIEQGIKMLMDAICALEEVHKQGIIHCKIKPSNLMITNEGVLKITDFGIAFNKKADEKLQPSYKHLIEYPLFMSPQQWQGKKIDESSDIYALGITFYYAFAGVFPIKGDSLIDLMNNHIHQKIKDPREYNSEIPLEIAQILLKMLEKLSEARYQSMNEIVSDLRAIL